MILCDSVRHERKSSVLSSCEVRFLFSSELQVLDIGVSENQLVLRNCSFSQYVLSWCLETLLLN